MVNKQQIRKMAKKITGSKSGFKSPVIMHPSRDWGIGLFIAVIILLVCVMWSAEIYIKYRDISVSETNFDKSKIVVYRESQVNSALNLLKERQVKHEELMSEMRTTSEDNLLNISIEAGDMSTLTPSSTLKVTVSDDIKTFDEDVVLSE